MTVPESQLRRLLVSAATGHTLVMFDFGLFGAVSALVFPKLFFPALSPFAALMATFLTFAVGFIARPLGAITFSHLGDRFGRKRMLVLSLSLMGVASVGIGLLPGYSTIGVAAPTLLVLLRFAQGFCVGGEPGAAVVMALEYAPPGRRATTVSAVTVGSALGQVLITVSLVTIRALVGEAAFIAWAWRIPFLFGVGMMILGVFIRRRIAETPVFQRVAEVAAGPRLPLVALVRRYPKVFVLLVLVGMPSSMAFYVGSVYSLSYFKETLHLSSDVGLTVLFAAHAIGIFLLLAGARLSDRYGRKNVLYVVAGVSLIGSLLYFPLVNSKGWLLMLVATLLTAGMTHAGGAARAALFAESFPTEIRYTGQATVSTVGILLGGSLTPFIATALLEWTGTPWSIATMLALAVLVNLAVLPFIRETANIDLEDSYAPATESASPVKSS